MEREVEETSAAEEIRRRLQLREANLVKKFVFLSHVSISGVLDCNMDPKISKDIRRIAQVESLLNHVKGLEWI